MASDHSDDEDGEIIDFVLSADQKIVLSTSRDNDILTEGTSVKSLESTEVYDSDDIEQDLGNSDEVEQEMGEVVECVFDPNHLRVISSSGDEVVARSDPGDQVEKSINKESGKIRCRVMLRAVLLLAVVLVIGLAVGLTRNKSEVDENDQKAENGTLAPSLSSSVMTHSPESTSPPSPSAPTIQTPDTAMPSVSLFDRDDLTQSSSDINTGSPSSRTVAPSILSSNAGTSTPSTSPFVTYNPTRETSTPSTLSSNEGIGTPFPSFVATTDTIMPSILSHDEGETTDSPTLEPSVSPSTLPPSRAPFTDSPTLEPSVSPSTLSPSRAPSTASPTLEPSVSPSTSSPSIAVFPSSSPSENSLSGFVTAWFKVGEDIEGTRPGASFGSALSVSADGTRIVVGAGGYESSERIQNNGLVRVFENQDGQWTQLGADIEGERGGHMLGHSVSMSGDGQRIAVGIVAYSPFAGADPIGQVKVFENNNGNWEILGQPVNGEEGEVGLGSTVDLSFDGSIVAVGVQGLVRVYKFVSSTWTQIGDDIEEEQPNDGAGLAVALANDGMTVAIGAQFQDSRNFADNGQARVYRYSDNSWSQVGRDLHGVESGALFGGSVSLSSNGKVVAVGGHNHGETNFGHVRVFKCVELTTAVGIYRWWSQLGASIDGTEFEEHFGSSISLSADGFTVAIGADGYDGRSGINSGTVRIFSYGDALGWTQIGQDIDGSGESDHSGSSVSLSADGTRVVIGSHGDEASLFRTGHVQVFDLQDVE